MHRPFIMGIAGIIWLYDDLRDFSARTDRAGEANGAAAREPLRADTGAPARKGHHATIPTSNEPQRA
jgi:hypothetical protein